MYKNLKCLQTIHRTAIKAVIMASDQSSAVPSSEPVPGSRDVPSCRYGSVPTRRYIPGTEYAKKNVVFFSIPHTTL